MSHQKKSMSDFDCARETIRNAINLLAPWAEDDGCAFKEFSFRCKIIDSLGPNHELSKEAIEYLEANFGDFNAYSEASFIGPNKAYEWLLAEYSYD